MTARVFGGVKNSEKNIIFNIYIFNEAYCTTYLLPRSFPTPQTLMIKY